MKRALIVAVLILLAAAGLLEAQTTGITDREIQRFVVPGSANRTGFRVHASNTAVHMSLTIPAGNIIARGGYKTMVAFAHGENTKPSLTDVAMVLAGSARPTESASGVSYQRTPFAGSIIGVTIGASAALTAGSATAEATWREIDGTVRRSFLTAVISGTAATQFNATAQARGVNAFTASDGIGCQITTSSDLLPVTAEMVCTVIIEF